MLALESRRLFGVIATGVVGLSCIIWGVREAIKGARARKWRSTNGVITVSRVQPDWQDRWGNQLYRVVISYAFPVAGTSRVGHQVCVGDAGGGGLDAGKAQRRADRYAIGTPVEVYYDPLDPSRTLLETGISGNVVAGILFGVLTLGAGALMLLWRV